MIKFSNPYASEKSTRVVMVDVGQEDYYLIKTLRPEQGTMSGVLGTLWKKLCDELRRRDFGDYTHREEFEKFVMTCRIVDGKDHHGQ